MVASRLPFSLSQLSQSSTPPGFRVSFESHHLLLLFGIQVQKKLKSPENPSLREFSQGFHHTRLFLLPFRTSEWPRTTTAVRSCEVKNSTDLSSQSNSLTHRHFNTTFDKSRNQTRYDCGFSLFARAQGEQYTWRHIGTPSQTLTDLAISNATTSCLTCRTPPPQLRPPARLQLHQLRAPA